MSYCPDYEQEELVSPSSCVIETSKLIPVTKSARQSTVTSGRRAVGPNDAPYLLISRKQEFLNKFRQVHLKEKKPPKSLLNEVCDFQRWERPIYEEIDGHGYLDGFLLFRVSVYIELHKCGIGKGKSKKEAERDAAKNALDIFLDVTDADREGKGRKVQYDDYGTAVPSETGVPLYSARRKTFKPRPSPVATLEKQKHESQAFLPTSVDKPAPAVSLESRNTNTVLPPVPRKPFPEGFRNDCKSAKDCFSKACKWQGWSSERYCWYQPRTSNGTTVFSASAVANGYKYEAGEGTSKNKAKKEAIEKALNVIFGASDQRSEKGKDKKGLNLAIGGGDDEMFETNQSW